MEFSSVNTIWVLLGAALVFFMQAGFAMVETGFTRAKNAGNIIMKNLMDFCLGTPIFCDVHEAEELMIDVRRRLLYRRISWYCV